MASAATATAVEPNLIYLKDYKTPEHYVDHVSLDFELDDQGLDTRVRAELSIRPDCAPGTPLSLDGECVELIPGSLAIDGKPIAEDSYTIDSKEGRLVISNVPDVPFKFTSEVRIKPLKNTELSGLYMSDGLYVTQCEAMGFRRITYFPDRPDVMATYKVRLTANKDKFPVLLSNGNLVDSGEVVGDSGRHWAVYEDPFKKPSYLFALVAGDLVHLEDKFTTRSGRDVQLRIYVVGESEVPKCEHAMVSLKKAMKWEEDVYGLEYDLDIFNIVAVTSFNMGAMENKSLNIFNTKCVLASKETATDVDFTNVERVIAHEYFHNYSGNRVTVNSWFQLSLKEGLTVFRDQCFSSDMNSASVRRIRDVAYLRTVQFSEDSGPMAHPIRPLFFQTINNFYTTTVYKKGSEVIRMLHTLCGTEGYRKGTDIYFSRHDGQAVTTDEWMRALHDANPNAFDFDRFKRWYDQAGTPSVTVDSVYDADKKTLTLNMSQVVPPTYRQPTKLPALIPVKTGIIGPDGAPVPVDLGDGNPELEKVLVFQEEKQSFVLHNVPEGSMPSMLRNFSAPVKFCYPQGESVEKLAFQMANDTDEFNKWEAGQKLAMKFISEGVESDKLPEIPAEVIEAFRKSLTNDKIEMSLRAELFYLPSETYILQQVSVPDPVKIRESRKHFRTALAKGLEKEFEAMLDMPADTEYTLDIAAQGRRDIKNISLAYLALLGREDACKRALEVVRAARNMTEVQSALITLSGGKSKERELALAEFAEKWKDNRLVMSKWLSIQACAPRDDALDIAKGLMEHEAFKITVPTCVYSVLGGYAANMHIPTDGSGYQFMADQVLRLDKINAQVAARIARVFTKILKYDEMRQCQMRVQLERIKATEGLSKDVSEIVSNCLAAK